MKSHKQFFEEIELQLVEAFKVDTSDFKQVHGSEPKGSDSWIFFIDVSPDDFDPRKHKDRVIEVDDDFRKAKKEVEKIAKRNGFRNATIYVSP